MLVYLSICSLIGGLSVVATQGLGAAIVAQAGGTKQYDQPFLYILFAFVVATLITEIIYLNVSTPLRILHFCYPGIISLTTSASVFLILIAFANERIESAQPLQRGDGYSNLLRLLYQRYHHHFRNPIPRVPCSSG